jgi:hypothetical protein
MAMQMSQLIQAAGDFTSAAGNDAPLNAGLREILSELHEAAANGSNALDQGLQEIAVGYLNMMGEYVSPFAQNDM